MATPTGLRRVARFAVATSLVVLVATGSVPPADAATPSELESCFLEEINAARADNGAPDLVLSSDLSAYGRTHSTTMAAAGSLFHSEPSQLGSVLPSGWQAWGENVGYATGSESCDWLFEGFWESPGHRDVLLNPIFDTVGIGVIVDADDTMWTTHVFVQTPDPPPTATTTTQPATTTSSSTIQSPTTAGPDATTGTTTTVVTIEAASGTLQITKGDAAAPRVETEAGASFATDTVRGEPVVSGIETACTSGCSGRPGYVMFLVLVGVTGGAISWWAFRT